MPPRNRSRGKGKAADQSRSQSQPPQSDHYHSTVAASPSTSRPIKPLPTRSLSRANNTLVHAHHDASTPVPAPPTRESAPSIVTDTAAPSRPEPHLAVASSSASTAAGAAASNEPTSEHRKNVRTPEGRKAKQRAARLFDSNPANTLPHHDHQRTAPAPTTLSSTSQDGGDSSVPRSAPGSASSDQAPIRDYDDGLLQDPDAGSFDRDLGKLYVPNDQHSLESPQASRQPISGHDGHDGQVDEADNDPFNEGFYEHQHGPQSSQSSHGSYTDDPASHDERPLDSAKHCATSGKNIALECTGAVKLLSNFDEETRLPREEVLLARNKLITMLEDFMNAQRFNWGHSHNPFFMPIHIEPFGSVRFGLATEVSDLDMCLFDPYRPEGFTDKFFSSSDLTNKSLPQIYNPRSLATKLQSLPYIRQAIPIPFATVPIVKIEAVVDGYVIQGDINTNERLGVLNSRLITAYCELHPMFRLFCVFLKHWARSRELNDPSGSKGPITMSSYTVILLAINYLQQIDHLPNLQDKDLIERTSTPQTRFFSTPRVRKTHGKSSIQGSTGWDTTFVEDYPGQWYDGPVTTKTGLLKEWVLGFFTYYSGEDPTSFDSERHVVAIKLGRAMARERRYLSSLSVLDGGIEGFAPVATGRDPASALADGTMSGERTDPDLIDGLRHLNIEPIDVRLASRSSSPIEYDDFEEPRAWQTHALVVQDPFYVERNTASNIRPEVVDMIKGEMKRARTMVEMGLGIEQICERLRPGEGARKLRRRYRAKDHKVSPGEFLPTQWTPELARGSNGNAEVGTKDGRAGGKSGRAGRSGGQGRRRGRSGAPPSSDGARPPLQRYATSSSEGHIVYEPPRRW
ncbi:BQ2448_8120 [Microbotryum intermedium]|uniref:BQ2448_8120 protein n=1 Tax=Microbotryum intermedium TaxID=269621 RepID=A0A238FQK8_9BASI|nr:BQ2448_8120 [Microbotryum intermedium]